MTLRDRITLIPRNNWDYGAKALVISVGGLRGGARRTQLEKMFGREPVWTTSGRTSLYAILKALDLPAGAKVGVPLFCCSVVFEAICQAGLSPLFLDSNLDDANVSADDLRKKRADLAAVIAVHMFGKPCDMHAILAEAGGIAVIEDCAQSIFSTYKGRQTGLLATASFFSFRCGKYISAGEGSAIFCKDEELHKKVQQVVESFERWSTASMLIDAVSTYVKATLYHRPWYGAIGYPIGMRLDKKLNLTAKDGFTTVRIAPTHLALIDRRVAGFEEKIDRQKRHAQMLLDALSPADFGLPSEGSASTSNWFQFALRFQNTDERDVMAEYLYSQGIDTAKYLDTIVDEARSRYGYDGQCPNAEMLAKTVLLVPIYYTLRARDIEHIARSINEGAQIIANRERRLYPMKQARETASVHES